MDKHTQQRPRARSSKQGPALPPDAPPRPQAPAQRPVFAPITPELQAAHERLSAAHWRACVALALAEQEHAEREAATRRQEAANEERPATR